MGQGFEDTLFGPLYKEIKINNSNGIDLHTSHQNNMTCTKQHVLYFYFHS